MGAPVSFPWWITVTASPNLMGVVKFAHAPKALRLTLVLRCGSPPPAGLGPEWI